MPAEFMPLVNTLVNLPLNRLRLLGYPFACWWLLLGLAPAVLTAAATGPQFLLFSGEKTWDVRSHHSERYRIAFGDMWGPGSWTEPDYFNGHLYLRFEVVKKPTDAEMSMQLCLWYGDYATDGICELCVYRSDLPWFTFHRAGDVVYVKYPAFSAWTHHQGRPWRPDEPFHKVLFQMRYQGKQAKVGDHPRYSGPQVAPLLPVKWRAEGYIVVRGARLQPPAHWQDLPAAWRGDTEAQPGIYASGP